MNTTTNTAADLRLVAILADGSTHTQEVLHDIRDTAVRFLECELDFFHDEENRVDAGKRTVMLVEVNTATGAAHTITIPPQHVRQLAKLLGL